MFSSLVSSLIIWSMSFSVFMVVVAIMFLIFGSTFSLAFSASAVSRSSCSAFSMLFVPTLISLPDQKIDTLPCIFLFYSRLHGLRKCLGRGGCIWESVHVEIQGPQAGLMLRLQQRLQW